MTPLKYLKSIANNTPEELEFGTEFEQQGQQQPQQEQQQPENDVAFINDEGKEVQIIYRLFLVNCYLLHVPRLPSQPARNVGGLVIH